MSAPTAIKPKTSSSSDLTFDGSNWEDLARLATQAKLMRLSETEVDSDKTQSAWLARHYVGAAMDWFVNTWALKTKLLDDFEEFLTETRNAFGITDDLVLYHGRTQLEALRWRNDLPTFFAEFDRLSLQCGLGADTAGKLELLRTKIPEASNTLLAQQAFVPSSYVALRTRLLTMWVLDPKSSTSKADKINKSKPKCGRCGKKGHTSAECRSSAKAAGN